MKVKIWYSAIGTETVPYSCSCLTVPLSGFHSSEQFREELRHEIVRTIVFIVLKYIKQTKQKESRSSTEEGEVDQCPEGHRGLQPEEFDRLAEHPSEPLHKWE